MDTLPTVNVQPGQIYLARDPMILKTILGSCVGVTFWSPRLGTGGLCHGILPRCPAGGDSTGYRYVDYSIRYLVEQFEAIGVRRQELEIKLFGGADVLPVGTRRLDKPTIGAMNCLTALEVLKEEGLSALASDLGGTRGRTIHFHTGTGEVFAHRLARLITVESPGSTR